MIITSYEMLMVDLEFFRKTAMFKYLVVDEGQRLKNFDCKLFKSLKHIKSDNRLLLSGTPLQNSVKELWSLLNFLLPEVFSDLDTFLRWFNLDGVVGNDGDAIRAVLGAEVNDQMVSKLQFLVQAYCLRRLKEDVELSLPGKREFVLWAPLAPEQAVLQKAILGRTTAELYASISAKGCRVSGGASGSATNMLMELRKNCNHPDLITGRLKGETQFPPAEELIAACGKLALLDRMLTRLRAKGHRVLIFSQMVRLLDLLDAFLEARSHPDST